MARKHPRKQKEAVDQAARAFDQGVTLVGGHPLFEPLIARAMIWRERGAVVPQDGWAAVTNNGFIYVHPTRQAAPEEWAYVLAHCLLHLGFEHFQPRPQPLAWNAACDSVIAHFLASLKIGRPPAGYVLQLDGASSEEEKLYRRLSEQGAPAGYVGDLLFQPATRSWGAQAQPDWAGWLGAGLAAAVTSAVDLAGGRITALGRPVRSSRAEAARAWFISNYPLLGALAASFEINEDPLVCQQLGISIGAVDPQRKKIYINPAAGLTEGEHRFVMAHELLHVGLRHDVRCQGRDPYLWNIACDYVINAWLLEMAVGDMPPLGLLYDPALNGESAESIYDLIVTDLRRFRRLGTLRGVGMSDILDAGDPAWWLSGAGLDLDAWYRSCLAQGLEFHQQHGRGFLPAGMIEEIRALSMPPIPWDVKLARWFDCYFPPEAQTRTYARPSRRQSATPDIPRPRLAPRDQLDLGRTFGVILDTSGSMAPRVLAEALGTIASYSLARDVTAVRVVFCDTVPYDQGYMAPEAIADSVRVKGRGGTILQPAIDLLEHAADFPASGPLLIITDGACDRLAAHRDHAYLLPLGRRLPFRAQGEVFYIPG